MHAKKQLLNCCQFNNFFFFVMYLLRAQVMFTGHRNSNSKGFIAIDDITMQEGACSDQSMYSETHLYLIFRGIQDMPIWDFYYFGLLFFPSFQVHAGLIPAYVALLMVPVTWVAGFVKEPQKMRWITPTGLKMVSRNLLLCWTTWVDGAPYESEGMQDDFSNIF